MSAGKVAEMTIVCLREDSATASKAILGASSNDGDFCLEARPCIGCREQIEQEPAGRSAAIQSPNCFLH